MYAWASPEYIKWHMTRPQLFNYYAEIQQLEYEENYATARLTATFGGFAGVKTKSGVSPGVEDYMLPHHVPMEVRTRGIDPAVAFEVKDYLKHGDPPAWLIEVLPVDDINASARLFERLNYA